MFAELKIKTNFSFLQGASPPDVIMQRAIDIGLPAVAIADVNGVYALPKAYWKLKDFPQCKLICGVDLNITDHPHITLLAQSREAYGLMCRIITKAHAGKEKGAAKISLGELGELVGQKAGQGLFCLPDTNQFYKSALTQSVTGNTLNAQFSNMSQGAPAQVNFLYLKELFGERLYFPISRFLDGFDQRRLAYAQSISESFDIKLVATNDVLYHAPKQKPVQDILACVREGISLVEAGFQLTSNGERYLKSPFEMKLLFKDFPETITNSMIIADQCTFSLSELRYRYPSEWIPKNHSAQSYLEELTWNGAEERYHGQVPDLVKQQILHEFQLIKHMAYADYFLTIYDIVSFARSRDILCQGRGSAANSVICYCLGITAIDPVRMQLLFERFISSERNEPPDIDVDFEHERREEVIQYIYSKYGRDRAAMVSAVVTYQRRSALRDVAKAFAVDVGTLSAKELARKLATSHVQSPNHLKDKSDVLLPVNDLVPSEDKLYTPYKELIDKYCEDLSGFPRHLSIHSGGFTLSADPIIEIVPVEPARMDGRTIIQWDKYDLDYLGLLKVDVLALGMLSAIKKTLKLIGRELHEIPAEDKATYSMIQRADTVGTFQVESRAQMNMSGRLRPRTYYDLVVQVAIVRPGPIVGKMVHPYLRRRQGLEKVYYPHPKLYQILGKTLGVPLFQEQLMKIAIDIGGFTPGEADKLRRAIGAWRASGSVQKIAEDLLYRLCAKGIPKDYALNILEHMKGFAHYGFPESHAASFALLTYASCYLKCHHPAEFACGLINSWPMGFYQPHTIIDDVKRHGVKVLPVDINLSQWDCTVEKGQLRLGLRIVVGLSEKEANNIIINRSYLYFDDFLKRTNLRKDVLYRLAMGGAFAAFGADQRHTLWQILSYHVKNLSPQRDLFSLLPLDQESAYIFTSLNAYEAVSADYGAFGLSVRGHPLKALRDIKNLPNLTIAKLKQKPPKIKAKVAGLLLLRQKPPTANGVCFAALEDETGILDLVLFNKVYEKYKEIFGYQCFFTVSGFIEREGFSVSFIVRTVESIFKEEQDCGFKKTVVQDPFFDAQPRPSLVKSPSIKNENKKEISNGSEEDSDLDEFIKRQELP